MNAITASTTIQYTIGQCSRGVVLVACSNSDICAILIAEHADTLRAQVIELFQEGQVQEKRSALQRELAQVAAFVDGVSMAALAVMPTPTVEVCSTQNL